MNNNYIGIYQRVPLNILKETLIQFLSSGKIEKSEIIEKLSLFFKGTNRINKAYIILKRIFSKNNILKNLKDNLTVETFNGLEEHEKNALILALITQTYPFSFSLVTNLASIFKVQETCNTTFIYNKMSSYYGSNRTTSVAIYSIIPLLIEMSLIKRIKPGLYSLNRNFTIKNNLIIETLMSAYFFNNKTKSLLFDDLSTHPWFFFFKLKINNDFSNFKILNISKSDFRNSMLVIK
jgi:hypothetical protein